MSLQILKRPQCVLWASAAKVLCQRLAVALKRKPRQDDEGVERPPERLGRHDEADREDPQGDPVVAPPEPDLYDRIARVLVDGSIVHYHEDITTCSRGVQCSLLVEEPLHEVGAREPVEEEPLVPVLLDDGDVVGLGPPAAADDQVRPDVRLQRGCLSEKVAAHVTLASLPGARDHEDHRSPLHERGQSAVPPREHLFEDPVYISLR